eukprot:TRINITY_DN46328_c0_g1_i1.p1 TRINITY_DN46328_c0_g1~~TRINITY_DN46328_c0_g1_i1.p1  ORF type:complete len:375 (-),score=37.28 TRINITY_DN46328_c0_g1_i1:284-1360(-)
MVCSSAAIAGLFVAHATCSVSMLLLNKTVALEFNYVWTTLLIQNAGGVLLGYCYSCLCSRSAKNDNYEKDLKTYKRFLGMKIPRHQKNLNWVFAQTVLFLIMLFISLRALRIISVPLYVVARNMVPAVTALCEKVFIGSTTPPVAAAGLFLTVVGAVVYSWGDFTVGSVDFVGVAFALSLVLVVAVASVTDKISVRLQRTEEDLEPVEVNQLRFALSLPLNVLLVMGSELHPQSGEKTVVQALFSMSLSVWVCLILSMVFGFGIGTLNFYLQQALNATAVQVANILYKLVTTLISRITHPVDVAFASWVGYAISLAGVSLYTFGPQLVKHFESRRETNLLDTGGPSALELGQPREGTS